MRYSQLVLIIVLSILLLPISSIANDNTPPSKRFTAMRVFDIEYATDPQISPDGKTIAYVRHTMDRMQDKDIGRIWLLNTENEMHWPLTENQVASHSPRWSPDGKRLLFISKHKTQAELRVFHLANKQSMALAPYLISAPSRATWSPDGQLIAFNMFVKAKKPSFASAVSQPDGAQWNDAVKVYDELIFRFDGMGYLPKGTNQVFTLPIEGGTPRQLTHSDVDMEVSSWLNNETILVTGNTAKDRDLDFIESEIYAIAMGDLSITPLTTRDGPDAGAIVSPNGKYIAYIGYDDKVLSYQQSNLYIMNSDGSNSREIAADFPGSIAQIKWESTSKSLLFSSEDQGNINLYRTDLKGKVIKLFTGIGGGSIGRPYANGSFSVSQQSKAKIAYMAGFSDRPAEIGLSDHRGKKQKILTKLNDDLLPYLDMASVQELKVKSSHDGKEIQAWVAFPPDFKADGSFPMILEIHGGPYTMYGPYFASEMQRYAAEGYVTVWANPRGSTGYGEDFALAIDRAYPGNDYHDLMTVVDEVIARNYVDDKRLFVTGGSGGGILTAWIVTKTQRFAAAAAIKPVINWMTMALVGDIAPFVRRHWIREDPWSNPEAFLKFSPISYVDKVKTPTLLMVGEEDYRTPTWEAEQFYTALKMLSVDTALIRVPSAPHYIAARPSLLIAKTDNIMAWFAKYDVAKKGLAE
ncbi:acylaminoacyl-peptidase [Colwellia chukchiensis]|uniref:Acylaminoacyl-peptidase n=1 Tax=Colwellia chukchiensis TaxID=641665 RepID=A0A1H7SL73_9GAMM|nr:S9 family peptidase [Colwellia chukchiensis]SEL73265.1 acylaminoacyl-peptidase [Colwellia chukchiensis]